MYNLIVGAVDGTLRAERLLEDVEVGLEGYVGSRSAPNIGALMTLPTLLIPEVGDLRYAQYAQVGTITNLYRAGVDYHFDFVRNPAVPAIPSHHIEAAARGLHLSGWGLSRTRWSVKNSDLYRVLVEDNLVGIPFPVVFSIPLCRPEPDRVAVMMPFDAAFNPVWDVLRAAGAEAGWSCQRADDIWDDSVVLNDVVALIARSKVIICDLTNRNSNVFYETGIAHALGREVIMITQTEHDIPFDLAHFRYIKYLANAEGLLRLKSELLPRLQTLMSK